MSKYLPGQVISILLLLLVLGVGCGAQENAAQSQPPQETSSDTSSVAARKKADKVVVYYFHTTYRCHTCNQFEQLTKEVLDEYFADEMAAGTIVWQVVNIEEEPNTHYVDDYGLVTKSLILSLKSAAGELEFKNLDQIWQLVRDTEKFKEYVKAAIELYASRID